jgi:hypothetical protein
MTEVVAAPSARRGAAREWRDADRCDHLLALHLTEAVHHLGAAALAVIDLPPLTGSSLEPAQLRAVATLLWAREVDQAGLLDFVDALAEGNTTGALLLPIGGGADRLAQFWRGRHQRFTADERRALYQRVFGDPADGGTTGLDQLVAALANVGATLDAGSRAMAQITVLAQEVAQQLSDRSAGITAWAARDIVNHIRAALELLQLPEIAGGLGGQGSPWTLIRLQSPMVLGHPIDPGPHLERARAGLQIVSWLAEVAESLPSGRVQLEPGAAVVLAAESWQVVSGHA